jgi:hypothetical protein
LTEELSMRHLPSRDLAPTLRLLVAAALTASALCTAACGGTDKAPAKPGAAAEVEDQLGFDQSGSMARQSRVEGAIRDCMKAEGFDYVPVDPVAQRAALLGSGRLSDQDFIDQFGYGISTLWGRGGAQADPNARTRGALGPADRRAYDRALWGENRGATFTDAVDRGDFTKLGGCTRKATEAVFGGAQVLTQIQGKLDSLDERILADQRMVRAIEKWSACMADAGFRYEEPEDIDSDLFDRMEKLVGPVPGQYATGPAPGETARSYDRNALRQLQRDEVAIARADYRCELKDITPVENVVRPEYEADFRRQNASLLGQIKPLK